MNYLSDAQSVEFAAILDGYEETVATANAGKTDTLDDIRAVLRRAGLKGSDLADELASFREAVAERRLIRTNPEKAERKAKKRDGATDYLFVLTDSLSCVHEGRNLDPENSQVQPLPPHNPDTGEIEAFAELAELVETITVLDRTGNEVCIPDDADMKSCGGGITTQPTSQEPPDTRITSREPTGTAGLATGPQDAKPLPAQQHRAIGGAPLKPAVDPTDLDAVVRQRQADTPDIPSFLKRANTGQAGRA